METRPEKFLRGWQAGKSNKGLKFWARGRAKFRLGGKKKEKKHFPLKGAVPYVPVDPEGRQKKKKEATALELKVRRSGGGDPPCGENPWRMEVKGTRVFWGEEPDVPTSGMTHEGLKEFWEGGRTGRKDVGARYCLFKSRACGEARAP